MARGTCASGTSWPRWVCPGTEARARSALVRIDVVCDDEDDAVTVLIERVRSEFVDRGNPLFVGLDGRSGTGKSTAAAALVRRLGSVATVIDGDDFYAGGSAATWDGRTTAQKVAQVIDWHRQRVVLQDLHERGAAVWHPFDWESPDWDSDQSPLSIEPIHAVATPVVVLEGAYSCRPELHDLLDLRVLLEVSSDIRRRRLLEREGEEYRTDWESRWSAAEDHYFGTVMPAHRFDLVVDTGDSRRGDVRSEPLAERPNTSTAPRLPPP